MSERKTVYITDFDYRRLWELFKSNRAFNEEERAVLPGLGNKLESAEVVYWRDIPPDIITMNSKVSLKELCTEDKITFDLVFPSYANPERNKVSILTPIGTAMLGCRTGDIIECHLAGGFRKLAVGEILYQPEACGNFNL
jgi:regulator of nucleoside diphosphate kinase